MATETTEERDITARAAAAAARAILNVAPRALPITRLARPWLGHYRYRVEWAGGLPVYARTRAVAEAYVTYRQLDAASAVFGEAIAPLIDELAAEGTREADRLRCRLGRALYTARLAAHGAYLAYCERSGHAPGALNCDIAADWAATLAEMGG